MRPCDFYRPRAIPDTGVKHYRPTPQMRSLNVVMLGSGIGVILWLLRNAAWQTHWLAAGALLLVAALMAAGLVYALTVRVTIDPQAIQRNWLCGRRAMVLKDIRQLGLAQYKGSVTLMISVRQKPSMSLSSDMFGLQDIRCMHRDILLAIGLDDEPMWPRSPRYLGFLDVEQVLRYRRFQAEVSGGAKATSEGNQELND